MNMNYVIIKTIPELILVILVLISRLAGCKPRPGESTNPQSITVVEIVPQLTISNDHAPLIIVFILLRSWYLIRSWNRLRSYVHGAEGSAKPAIIATMDESQSSKHQKLCGKENR